VKNLSAYSTLAAWTCSARTKRHAHEDHITLINAGRFGTIHAARSNTHIFELFPYGRERPLDSAIKEHEAFDTSAYKKLDEMPFDYERKRDTVVVQKDMACTMVAKGAPRSSSHLQERSASHGVLKPLDGKAQQEILGEFNA